MPETESDAAFVSVSDSALDSYPESDVVALVSTCGVVMLLLLRPAFGNRRTLFSMSTYDSNRLASFKILGLPIGSFSGEPTQSVAAVCVSNP